MCVNILSAKTLWWHVCDISGILLVLLIILASVIVSVAVMMSSALLFQFLLPLGSLEPPQASADSGETTLHCCIHSIHCRNTLGRTMGECSSQGGCEGRGSENTA